MIFPAELGDGKKVRQHYSLSDSKFEGCAKLETVSLPYTYGNPESPEYSSSYIGAACFKDCTALKEIELGGYVTVAEDAFLNCTALEKVMFDEYVRSIGAHALGYTKDAAGNYQLCAGLTICGTAGTAAEVYAEENGIPFVHIGRTGDIDDSGSVDVADAVLLARYLAEDREAVIGSAGMHQLDVNRDGGKDLNDVTQILRMIARYA